ncbi:MAG: hypothetical protein ABL952_01225 [Pyrinomonadaceae bacterium]
MKPKTEIRTFKDADGNEIRYRLELTTTDRGRRWAATAHFDNREKYVQNELLISDPGSEDAIKELADIKARELYEESRSK